MSAELDALLYESLHHGQAGDIAFYQNICENKSNILELGCGSGRLLHALNNPGRTLTGIDHNEALLKRAKARVADAKLIHQDMLELQSSDRFDAILAPFNTLYCLNGEPELCRLFALIKNHLCKGGVFSFDVWNASSPSEHFDIEDNESHFLTTLDAKKQSWQVYEQHQWDLAHQCVEARYCFIPEHGTGPSRTQLIAHHYVTAEWLLTELQQQGFIVKLYGGFNKQPFDDDAEHLVAICTTEDVSPAQAGLG